MKYKEKNHSLAKQGGKKSGLTREKMGERQIEITCDLMRLFGINHVDVTILNLASPFLCFQVLKYGKLLKCVQESEFFFFKSRAIGRYHEVKPMYNFYARKAIRDLQRRAAAPTGGVFEPHRSNRGRRRQKTGFSPISSKEDYDAASI